MLQTLTMPVRGLAVLALLAALAGCGGDAPPAKPPGGDAGKAPGKSEPLLVHVGGTMQPAIEEICKLYTAETGQKVELNKNDSGALMAAIEQTKKGDIYVAHDPFPVRMEKQGLAEKTYLVASLTPVIVVRKGNPKVIKSISDLTKPEIKVGLTDEKYSTLGWILPVIFRKAGIAEAMAKKNVARARSGGEMANSVMVGANDAAIVWNAVAFNRKDGLDTIDIYPQCQPDAKADAITSATYGTLDISRVAVAAQTLKCSKQPDNARKLAELVDSERGRAVFAKRGFSPAPAAGTSGGTTEGKISGRIFVYCAAGAKDPVSELAAAFTKETGVEVEMTFANSGQLLGQADMTRTGDVYIPGDTGFIDQARAKGLVAGRPRDFCWFVPTILVQKGNPKGLKGLEDLARPAMRLALADDTAAIGKLQAKIFEKNKLDVAAIKKNVVASPATVTDTALTVKMKTVDAAVVWDSTAAMFADDAEIVKIPIEKNVIGIVASAVLASSRNRPAAEAFADYLASAKGREVLRAKGFTVEAPK